ncbi:MAG: excinuclease ABC subunit UvrA [Patescibacteria group bacterium]
MQDKIIIRGAREHNLKNISLELPRNKMIVFTGLSGSGKSSLAFDTIFAEGQRRYIESLSAYARQFLGKMDKPDVDEIEGLSPAISIDQKAHSANPRSTVATITEIYDYLRVLFARVGKPHCPVCEKPIRKMTVEEMADAIFDRLVKEVKLKVQNDNLKAKGIVDTIMILAPLVRGRKGEYHQMLYDLYNGGFAQVRVDGKIKNLRERLVLSRYKQHTIELVVDRVPVGYPIKGNKAMRSHLGEALESALSRGHGVVTVILPDGGEFVMSSQFSCPDDGFSFPEIEPRLFSFNSPYGYCPACTGLGTESLFSEKVCQVCNGDRLRKESLRVLINGKSIVHVTRASIAETSVFFAELKLTEVEREIATPVLREIAGRIKFMLDVGLDYLTLDRKAGTLSGGEAQRIRLASQLGSRLTGTLYVLDEPTIGLHQHDNAKLIQTLLELRDIGNTVIVVEHDEETIRASDYFVDLGPGAGKHGGYIVVQGETAAFLNPKNPIPKFKGDPSLTLQYLRGEVKIPVPGKRRGDSKERLKIVGATANNLKNINLEIPLRRFVCLTGVSGSGKSTLLDDIIYKAISNKLYRTRQTVGAHKMILGLEYIDRVVDIDQSPIGRTPRSNPATYTGAWSHVRDLFAATEEARMRNYPPGRFSFNVAAVSAGGIGGRCEHCQGHGQLAIEMHFLPTVWVTCDVCKGRRFDAETMEVLFKGRNISQILGMTIDEADDFFRDIPAIHDRLKIMREVGLGYLELGQSATTLSGGEAQRVKLASELASRNTRALYLFDEPTVGLHYDDVRKLMDVLQRLVSTGNSVIVIEHNLDVIKCADYLIDLGPDGGDGGGRVVASGTPEEVAKKAGSKTGVYLKHVL